MEGSDRLVGHLQVHGPHTTPAPPVDGLHRGGARLDHLDGPVDLVQVRVYPPGSHPGRLPQFQGQVRGAHLEGAEPDVEVVVDQPGHDHVAGGADDLRVRVPLPQVLVTGRPPLWPRPAGTLPRRTPPGPESGPVILQMTYLPRIRLSLISAYLLMSRNGCWSNRGYRSGSRCNTLLGGIPARWNTRENLSDVAWGGRVGHRTPRATSELYRFAVQTRPLGSPLAYRMNSSRYLARPGLPAKRKCRPTDIICG